MEDSTKGVKSYYNTFKNCYKIYAGGIFYIVESVLDESYSTFTNI